MWILFYSYNFLIDILFPKYCFVCKKSGNTICKTCLLNFPQAVNTPSSFIYPYFSYKDEKVKKIMRAIKYYHRKDLILPLVESTISENLKLKKENCILVPIPMHNFRKIIRGYNQAEIISKKYSQILNIPYATNILYRTKFTSRQVKSKNKSERIKNQKGSFEIKNFNDVQNKTIILIDDVTTTGATINEARKVFLENDFKKVIAITLAH